MQLEAIFINNNVDQFKTHLCENIDLYLLKNVSTLV